MCFRCGYETDHDEPWTPAMHRALELIRELYDTPDGGVGGPLHVQLDDMNLHDDQAYNHRPVEYGYRDWKDEPAMRRICDELLPLLMSIEEASRFTVLMTFHGKC